MKLNTSNQIKLPAAMIADMGIIPGQSELEFRKDTDGRWYVKKSNDTKPDPERFRNAHTSAQLNISTEDIMKLTRR